MRLLELIKKIVTTEHEFATLKQEIWVELNNVAAAIGNNPNWVAECLTRKITPLQFAINSCCDPSENPRRLTPLQVAVIFRNAALVQPLLEWGANLNFFGEDYYRRTPLHFAASANDMATLEVLLRYGADVHSKDLQGNTPLLVAIKNGCKSDEEALAALSLFMKYKADVNALDSREHSFIQYAAAKGFFKTVHFLLEQPHQRVVIPQEKSPSPMSPILYLPIIHRQVRLVAYLLARNVNIAAIDCQNKCTIFATACRFQNPNIIKAMLKYVTDAILIEDALREMDRHKINNDEIRAMLNQKKKLLPALLPTDVEEKLIQLTQLQPPAKEPNNLLPPPANPPKLRNSAVQREASPSRHASHHFWNNPSAISTPLGNEIGQQQRINAIANEPVYSNVAHTPVSSSSNSNDDSLFPGARFKAVSRGPNERVVNLPSADTRGAQSLLVPPNLDNSAAASKQHAKKI